MIPASYRPMVRNAAGFVIGVWLIVLAISLGVFCMASPDGVARWGQFGDAFGAANALFSGLALLGVIGALMLQREDVDLQRQDLQASIGAQKEAARAQEIQARIAAIAASLNAKQVIARSIEEAKAEGKHPRDFVSSYHTADQVLSSIRAQILTLNRTLDAELQRLYPATTGEQKP